jgi:hypothetical protein
MLKMILDKESCRIIKFSADYFTYHYYMVSLGGQTFKGGDKKAKAEEVKHPALRVKRGR